MNKEDQIREIYEQVKFCTGAYDDDARSCAQIIYEYMGYRKQREGEWIFKEYGEDTYTNLTRIYECSLCGRTIECLNEANEPYCHCGAKMKGGAE